MAWYANGMVCHGKEKNDKIIIHYWHDEGQDRIQDFFGGRGNASKMCLYSALLCLYESDNYFVGGG